MLNINYDNNFDVLYLGFDDKSNSVGDEIANGYILMTDDDTKEITGLTIFDFMHQYRNGNLKAISLPIDIDYENDVLPYIEEHRYSALA